MARNLMLVAFGVVLGVFGAAAAGSHAQDPKTDLETAAAAAHVNPTDLAGAVNSTGQDPWTYLRGVGELPSQPLPVLSSAAASPPAPARGSFWDRLVQCETNGNWHANTGNGFSGGPQFTTSTWRAYGGVGSPALASREQQIAVAERVLAVQGFAAWPACSRALGLR